MTKTEIAEIEFLQSLPVDGSLRRLQKGELQMAYRLHQEKKVFVVTGLWPSMMASITFEGRKVLSRAE